MRNEVDSQLIEHHSPLYQNKLLPLIIKVYCIFKALNLSMTLVRKRAFQTFYDFYKHVHEFFPKITIDMMLSGKLMHVFILIRS